MCGWIELSRIRFIALEQIARQFDDHHLHAETQTQVRDFVDARVPRRENHSFDPALAETARHNDAVRLREPVKTLVAFQVFGQDPINLNRALIEHPGMIQSLVDTHVSVR